MVLSTLFGFLCFIAAWCCIPTAYVEKRLLCSSETNNIWYTYDGPLYYLSITASPCSLGVSTYNLTYTVIPMFTITHLGYHVVVHYNGQLWLEYTHPYVPCEDFKLCYIIKGETLHETLSMYSRKMIGPKGEYKCFITINIIDDIQGPLTLRFNVTFVLKSDDQKNNFFPTARNAIGQATHFFYLGADISFL